MSNLYSFERAVYAPRRELMRLRGSIWLSNSFKQELVVYEDHAYGEVLGGSGVGLKRIKMSLPFDRIAQVNLIRGIFTADLELVNSGGADNLVVRALRKHEAEAAKTLIERKIAEWRGRLSAGAGEGASVSIADEIAKLARLRTDGVISGAEFEAAKKKLLGR